jgi:hypothetical protein
MRVEGDGDRRRQQDGVLWCNEEIISGRCHRGSFLIEHGNAGASDRTVGSGGGSWKLEEGERRVVSGLKISRGGSTDDKTTDEPTPHSRMSASGGYITTLFSGRGGPSLTTLECFRQGLGVTGPASCELEELEAASTGRRVASRDR